MFGYIEDERKERLIEVTMEFVDDRIVLYPLWVEEDDNGKDLLCKKAFIHIERRFPFQDKTSYSYHLSTGIWDSEDKYNPYIKISSNRNNHRFKLVNPALPAKAINKIMALTAAGLAERENLYEGNPEDGFDIWSEEYLKNPEIIEFPREWMHKIHSKVEEEVDIQTSYHWGVWDAGSWLKDQDHDGLWDCPESEIESKAREIVEEGRELGVTVLYAKEYIEVLNYGR